MTASTTKVEVRRAGIARSGNGFDATYVEGSSSAPLRPELQQDTLPLFPKPRGAQQNATASSDAIKARVETAISKPGSDEMASPTREEIEANLRTAEARTETRFVELSAKIDRLTDSVGTLRTDVARELASVQGQMTTVLNDNKSTRTTIIVTVVASVIAGLGALYVTQGNLLSAFTTGIVLTAETHKDAPQPPNSSGGAGGATGN